MYGYALSLLVYAAGLWAVAGAAQAATCPPPGFPAQAPTIGLTTQLAEPQLFNEVDRRGLTAQAGNSLKGDKLEAGLTRTETEFRLVPTVTWIAMPGERHCLALARIEASWIQTKVRVDVAREYKPGSCQYREVKAHEMEHVRLTRERFQAQVPRLELALRQLLADTPPMVVTDPEQAANRLTERLMARLQPLLAEFKAETGRANAAIDTPESYRAVSARCENW